MQLFLTDFEKQRAGLTAGVYTSSQKDLVSSAVPHDAKGHGKPYVSAAYELLAEARDTCSMARSHPSQRKLRHSFPGAMMAHRLQEKQ